MEIVFFQSIPVMILYGIALILNIIDRCTKRGILTYISAAVCVAATVYALIIGAAMFECAAVLLVYLLLNMGVRE